MREHKIPEWKLPTLYCSRSYENKEYLTDVESQIKNLVETFRCELLLEEVAAEVAKSSGEEFILSLPSSKIEIRALEVELERRLEKLRIEYKALHGDKYERIIF